MSFKKMLCDKMVETVSASMSKYVEGEGRQRGANPEQIAKVLEYVETALQPSIDKLLQSTFALVETDLTEA